MTSVVQRQVARRASLARLAFAENSALVGWGFVFRLKSVPRGGNVHMASDITHNED
jgi:hypothetical protein